MTEELSVDSIAQHFITPEKNSDPAPSETQDDTLPEERAERNSESDDDGLPEVIEDDESEDSEEAEITEQTTEEVETTEAKAFEVPMPDGTVKKVTAEEFNTSYVPKSEFTRKTQEIAEQKRAFEQESNQVRQQQIAVLQALQDSYHTQANPIVQLQRVLQEANEIGDVETALRVRLDIQDEQKRQEQVANALAWERAQEAQRQQADDSHYIAEQSQKLMEKMPILSKPEGVEKFTKSVNKAMTKVGYTEAELSSMTRPDHRNAMLAFYAGKYLESLEAKPAVATALRGKAVSPTPSARQNVNGSKSDAAIQQLNKAPTAESLGNWFASRR